MKIEFNEKDLTNILLRDFCDFNGVEPSSANGKFVTNSKYVKFDISYSKEFLGVLCKCRDELNEHDIAKRLTVILKTKNMCVDKIKFNKYKDIESCGHDYDGELCTYEVYKLSTIDVDYHNCSKDEITPSDDTSLDEMSL